MDARPRQRGRGRRLQGVLLLGEDGSLAVDRIAESVKHTPKQLHPDLHAQLTPRCDDLAAGTDTLHLADRHEENAPLAESDNLRRHGRHPCKVRAHIAELTDRYRRSLRLDDQPDDLRHLARQLHRRSSTERILELMDIYGKWGIPPRFTRIHSITSRTAFFSCSICVCRRASTLPFGVSTRQSPGFRLSSDVIERLLSPAVTMPRSSSRAISTKS